MTRSFQLRENVLELKGKFVDVAGTNTRYYDLGEGEPTILIHGGGPGASGVSNYRKNIEPLSARRRVIVIDLPGFGETEGKLKDGPVFPAMGDFVRDFMDVIGIKKASFVGNSMGGATSLMVALRTPERVNKLVLMGTGGSQPIFSPMPTKEQGYNISTGGQIIHELGGARMGNDPKSSVVNANCQAHECKNLFITDGACMASTACQNPSITYMALTARAAAYAVDAMKRNEL